MFCEPTNKVSVAIKLLNVPLPGVVSPMLTLSTDPGVPEVSVIAPVGDTVRLSGFIVITGAVKSISVDDTRVIADVLLTCKLVRVPTLVKLLLTTELASVVALSTSAPLIFNDPVASKPPTGPTSR